MGGVPLIGEIADFGNGVWYLIEGDAGNPALSFASMMPLVVGSVGKVVVAAGGVLFTVKAIGYFDEVAGVFIFKNVDFTKQFRELGFTGEMVKNFVDDFTQNSVLLRALGKDPGVVEAWGKLANTGLRTNIKWLENVSKWIDDGLELTSTTTKVSIKKAGVEVGEISGDLLKVKYAGVGGDIVTHPTKTTSAIGRYQPNNGGAGTKNLIESGLTKSGENAGGVNVLNDLTNTQGWPDQQIWDQMNKPWIDVAISRGDVIRAVSDPTLPENIFKDGISGDLTFFGREHFHLTQLNGYTYNASTFTYVK